MGKWTRRAVLSAGVVGGTGLMVGVSVRPGNPTETAGHLVAGEGESLLHIFLKIDSDNRATAILPHSEMGQGAQTALTQMLAEELDADWNLIQFVEAPAEAAFANYAFGRGYLFKGVEFPDAIVPTVDGLVMKLADSMGMQVTGGSMSIRATGQYCVRAAGASVREMLVKTAAKGWGVPAREIRTEKSKLYHDKSGRSAAYAEFAAAAAQITPSSTPRLKKTSEFSVMGQSKQRLDIPSKVDGTAIFAMDVKRPGMLYAAVRRSPVFGGSLRRIDDREARAMNGVIDVVTLPGSFAEGLVGAYSASDSVAVVADSYWKAEKALNALEIEWNNQGNDTVSSSSIFEQFDRDIAAATDRQTDVALGDANTAFEDARMVLTADYRVPYLAHSCMEPPNATAEVSLDRAEIWIGCQNPLGFRQHIAAQLGMDVESVTLHNHFMGGGFGRKSNADYGVQAALIAQAVGRPVQLVYSRQEDIRQDFYRPAVQSRFKAGLDNSGKLVAWHNTYVDKRDPVEAPLIPYAVTTQDIGHVASPTHVPFGAWRSVDHSQHGFFTESFVDEVAHAAGKDPYEYRAEMLKDNPRLLAVLKRVAAEANWGSPLDAGRGRGISLQESFGSVVGQVIEVTVSGGKTWVDRVVAVIDAGFAVTPDGVKAQVESGIIYGLTAAMYGDITIQNGAVAQSSFADYDAIRMHDAPVIETHIINSGADIGGAGEPGTPGVAPALANAIFDATGKRIRTLPVMNADLRTDSESSPSVAALTR
jgi:isoquinoline 1-oxidoreductase beta subunit